MSKELRKRKREEDTDDVQRKIFQPDVAANDDESHDSSRDGSQRSSISRSDDEDDAWDQDLDSKSGWWRLLYDQFELTLISYGFVLSLKKSITWL